MDHRMQLMVCRLRCPSAAPLSPRRWPYLADGLFKQDIHHLWTGYPADRSHIGAGCGESCRGPTWQRTTLGAVHLPLGRAAYFERPVRRHQKVGPRVVKPEETTGGHLSANCKQRIAWNLLHQPLWDSELCWRIDISTGESKTTSFEVFSRNSLSDCRRDPECCGSRARSNCLDGRICPRPVNSPALVNTIRTRRRLRCPGWLGYGTLVEASWVTAGILCNLYCCRKVKEW